MSLPNLQKKVIVGEGAELLSELKEICDGQNLSANADEVDWALSKKDFSVKSLYVKYRSDMANVSYDFMWKAKIPHRIKFFVWLVLKNKILSKENLSLKI